MKAPFHGFVEPALATSSDKVPSGDRWIHETSSTANRVQLHIHNDAIKVFTRRGNDWTTRFSKIAADAFLINAGSAIIDGEVVVPAADGTTDFSVLQNELRGKSTRLVMIAFDLYLNGQDLRKLPLVERKTHLKKLIEKTAIQFSESFELDGKEMFEHACKVGLERTPRPLSFRARPGLGEENLCPARDADHRRLCARRQRLGRHLGRPPQGRRPDLCRQSRPRLRQEIIRRAAQAPDAADPQNPALRQAK